MQRASAHLRGEDLFEDDAHRSAVDFKGLVQGKLVEADSDPQGAVDLCVDDDTVYVKEKTLP